MQTFLLIGTLVSSYRWGWVADRFGGRIVLLSGVLTMLAAISWIWIDENRASFPIPTTDAGRDLALTYNVISHAIFISILIIAVGWMS